MPDRIPREHRAHIYTACIIVGILAIAFLTSPFLLLVAYLTTRP